MFLSAVTRSTDLLDLSSQSSSTNPTHHVTADCKVVNGFPCDLANALELSMSCSSLQPFLQAMLGEHEHEAVFRECVIDGTAAGKCPVWSIPGHQGSGWARLADGQFAKVRQVLSERGTVCIGNPGLGGGGRGGPSGPANENIAHAVRVTVHGNAFAQTSLILHLQEGMLAQIEGGRQSSQWGAVVAVLNELPALVWHKGKGNFSGTVMPRAGTADGRAQYEVVLRFKAGTENANPHVMPTMAQICYLSIARPNDDPRNRFTLNEQCWLQDTLERNSVAVPFDAAFWQPPGNALPVYFDRELMLVECNTPIGLLEAIPDYDAEILQYLALAALTDGGAYGQTFHAPAGTYRFDRSTETFSVNYEVQDQGVTSFAVYWNSHEDQLLAAWSSRQEDLFASIDGYDALSERHREVVAGYHRHRDPEGLRAFDPDDPYLTIAVRFLQHLAGRNPALDVDTFVQEPLEERRTIAIEFANSLTTQMKELSDIRCWLGAFLVSLKDDFDEPIDNPIWNTRIVKFNELEKPNNREALTQYYKEMWAAGASPNTMKSDCTNIRQYMKSNLDRSDSALKALVALDDKAREQMLTGHQQNKTQIRLLQRFCRQIGGEITVRVLGNLPTDKQHFDNLNEFVRWHSANCPESNDFRVKRHNLTQYMIHLEKPGTGTDFVRARDWALHSNQHWQEHMTQFKNALGSKQYVNCARIYRTWTHLCLHLKTIDGQEARRRADSILTDWLFHPCRRDVSTYSAGKGPWKILESIPQMTPESWADEKKIYLDAKKRSGQDRQEAAQWQQEAAQWRQEAAQWLDWFFKKVIDREAMHAAK